MGALHSCLTWEKDKRKPVRIMDQLSENRVGTLEFFGYEVAGVVL